MKALNYFWFIEPCIWIYNYFFRPSQFKKEFLTRNLFEFKNMHFSLRLALPLFLLSFPFALALRFFLPLLTRTTNVVSIGHLLFETAIGTLLGILAGMALGTIGGQTTLISFGLIGGITNDIPLGQAGALTQYASFSFWNFVILILVGTIATALVALFYKVEFEVGFIATVTTTFLLAFALGITILFKSTTGNSVSLENQNISIAIEDIIAGYLLSAVLEFNIGLVMVIALLLITSILAFAGTILPITSFFAGFLFLFAYIVGFFHPISTLLSCISLLQTLNKAQKNQSETLIYLKKSALHWIETSSSPSLLTYTLSKILALGVIHCYLDEVIHELEFIVKERPKQCRAAWATSLSILLQDLNLTNVKEKDRIYVIAKSATPASHLKKFVSAKPPLLNPKWITTFTYLNNISLDAAQYNITKSKYERLHTLKDISSKFIRIPTDNVFDRSQDETTIKAIVQEWREVIDQELENLEYSTVQVGHIDNPYQTGLPLAAEDELFVGRLDIIQELIQGLNRGSGRPTFSLTGERRMGKSSLLKQLPSYVGSHYLPIYYDLQTPDILADITTFFESLAEKITEAMQGKNLTIEEFIYPSHTKESIQQNELLAYRSFNKWLAQVEKKLKENDITLLLEFDEFEMLKDAENDKKKKHLHVPNLLNWFRSTMQNHPQIALLFCGLHHIYDKDISWSTYFVNVQTLKVSFLQPDEARKLIRTPRSDYNFEDVFSDEVVEKIMSITGSQPFLVQAVCETIIKNLNEENHIEATVADVELAAQQVPKSWDSLFNNFWMRTDSSQKAYLRVLKELGNARLSTIADEVGEAEGNSRKVLQKLVERDIVREKEGVYEIAIPIFSLFIAQLDE